VPKVDGHLFDAICVPSLNQIKGKLLIRNLVAAALEERDPVKNAV
jgi:hypothetical protein